MPWIIGIVAVSALSVLWYISIVGATGWESRPTGSKSAMFWFGVAGGSICFFEFLLWPRKKFRTLRIGKAQTWMRAHIWLGLLAVPLLLLHSSFYFQNLEATVLFVLFAIVIASGVWGLILQQFIPQRMLEQVPSETIFSQIDRVSNQMVLEADRIVVAVCGVTVADQAKPAPAVVAARQEEVVLTGPTEASYTVGAVRRVGAPGRSATSEASFEPVPDSQALREFFATDLADYLKKGKASGSTLANTNASKVRFQEVRMKLLPEAHAAVAMLENLAEQRRQLDHQARLHWWLHSWLWVHLPLSAALIILMFVHIFVTLKYWWPS
jgi:hypothetical protein